METTFIYTLLSLVIALPIIQLLVSMNYFKPFAFEYLENTPSSWNPNYDRRMVAFTVTFTFVSFFLAKEILQGNTENSWYITTFYFVAIVMFFFLTITVVRLQKKENSKAIMAIDKNDHYVTITKDIIQKLFEYLKIKKLISQNTTLSQFELIFQINKKNHIEIIWTGTYNRLLTYNHLIVLYKLILKQEAFSKELVREEIAKNFIFKKSELKSTKDVVEILNKDSFNKAFDRVDFENLINYQQEIFDEISQILK